MSADTPRRFKCSHYILSELLRAIRAEEQMRAAPEFPGWPAPSRIAADSNTKIYISSITA
eukprot:scaffold87322_cov20-Prasinocladus_malaysianus.AAC.1